MNDAATYKLVCWDFETTGKDPATARVVQLGAIEVRCGVAKQAPPEVEIIADVITNPGQPIHPQASEVHGITDAMVKDEQLDVDVCHEFVEYLESYHSMIQATHNGMDYDLPILERIVGKKLNIPMIDTLVVARRVMPEVENHQLGTLTKALGLGDASGAHEAVADVKMVHALIDFFCDQWEWTWEDLARYCEQPHIVNNIWFGKHKGKHFKDVPKGYLNFICDKFDAPPADLQVSVQYWHNMTFPNAVNKVLLKQ